jgi:hypothetical protein
LKRKGSSHNFGELIFACVALVNRDRAKNSPLASATHASNNLDAPETQQGGAGLLRFFANLRTIISKVGSSALPGRGFYPQRKNSPSAIKKRRAQLRSPLFDC